MCVYGRARVRERIWVCMGVGVGVGVGVFGKEGENIFFLLLMFSFFSLRDKVLFCFLLPILSWPMVNGRSDR